MAENIIQMKSYYIVAPQYVEIIAGFRVLWKLAASLRERGYDAKVVLYNDISKVFFTGDGQSPWGIETIDAKDIDKDGVVVYPEIVDGNPLGVKTVARILLNKVNTFHKANIDSSEIRFAFTKAFLMDDMTERDVFYIPTVETDLFKSDGSEDRTNKLVYFGKSATMRWNSELIEKTKHLWADAIEIKRGPQDRFPNTREKLAELMRSGYILYTYDDTTAIIMEAAMCGCPVIVMTDRITEKEFNERALFMDGIGFGEEQKEHAEKTVKRAYKESLRQIKTFDKNLTKFINRTQNAL